MLLTKVIQTESRLKIPAEGIFYLLLHFLFFGIVFFVWGRVFGQPSQWDFLNWDASWYKDLAENGYKYNPDRQSNVAFFPLFPFIWRLLSVGPLQMALINCLIFSAGAVILYNNIKPPVHLFLLALSVPSAFFFYVPYTESLFFFSGALLLSGLHNDKLWLAILGIFLACLTRSAAAIFIPALILTACFDFLSHREPKTLGKYLLLILSALAAVFIVSLIQYTATGEAFGFIKVQQHWGHELRLPTLPLNSWGSKKIVRFDSVALLFGIFTGFWFLYAFIKKIRDKEYNHSPARIFSVLYLAGVTCSVFFLQGGSFPSLNRYILATPFFLFFLITLNDIKLHKLKYLGLILIGLIAYGSLFKIYNSAKSINYTILLYAFVLTLFFLNHKKFKKPAFILLYLGNLILQAFFFQWFLIGEWVA